MNETIVLKTKVLPKTIIPFPGIFKITPKEVRVKPYQGFLDFDDTFEHVNSGNAAYRIIRLCQDLHSWGPFTMEQMNESCRKAGVYQPKKEPIFNFYNLISEGWIVLIEGKYYLTEEFVLRCHSTTEEQSKAYKIRKEFENQIQGLETKQQGSKPKS